MFVVIGNGADNLKCDKMITKQQFDNAVKLTADYKKQENGRLLTKDSFTWDEFLKFHSLKEGTPRDGDIVITSKSGYDGGNSKEDHIFEIVRITGYCLPDEFYGVNEEGKERFFLNTSFFKIILHESEIISQVE